MNRDIARRFMDEIVAVARVQVDEMHAEVREAVRECLRVAEEVREEHQAERLLRELYIAFAPCSLPTSKPMRERALKAAKAAKAHIRGQGWELVGERWMRADG